MSVVLPLDFKPPFLNILLSGVGEVETVSVYLHAFEHGKFVLVEDCALVDDVCQSAYHWRLDETGRSQRMAVCEHWQPLENTTQHELLLPPGFISPSGRTSSSPVDLTFKHWQPPLDGPFMACTNCRRKRKGRCIRTPNGSCE